jgi:Domain of unknown function (DUF5666)
MHNYNGSCTLVYALLALFVTTLTACGGGGGGSTNPAPSVAAPAPTAAPQPATPPPAATSPGADVIVGTITGFGSVYIDGKRFTTDNAAFTRDHRNATQNDLRIGMVVELRGSLDNGTASSVRFDEDVKGPVDSVGAAELSVLGQRVLVTPDTRFDSGLSLATILTGDVLEISGLRDATDALQATYIERKTAASINAFKVIGAVRDLDSTQRRFRVGSLVVDYSAARLDDSLTLAAGRLVEVKDDNKAYSPGDLRLIATRVERAGAGLDSTGRLLTGRTQIEGLIASVPGAGSFTLGGVTVRHSASTVFVFGTAANLAAGTRVQVAGARAADGSIDASRIKFSHNAARIQGLVENVNSTDGTLTVFGLQVRTSAATRFEDRLGNRSTFGINDLRRGDFVEIRGSSTGSIVRATEIRLDDQDDTRLRGPATRISASARTLSVLGVPVVTNTSTQYEGFADERLTADAFFAKVVENQTLVEAKWDGTVTDPSVPVHELSLED